MAALHVTVRLPLVCRLVPGKLERACPTGHCTRILLRRCRAGVDILISKTFCSQIFAAICKMISTEKILRAICILQIFGSARESAVASCNFLFLHLAFCIFLQIDAALICNLQKKNFAFCVFQRRFLLGSFNYGDKFQFRPKARNLQKVDFAFCILQLFAVLSTCQLARSKKKILHFAFFCEHAI